MKFILESGKVILPCEQYFGEKELPFTLTGLPFNPLKIPEHRWYDMLEKSMPKGGFSNMIRETMKFFI